MAKAKKGMGLKAVAKSAMPAAKKANPNLKKVASKRQRSAVASKRQRARGTY